MVSRDLLVITDALRDRVREMVKQSLPEIDATGVALNATHTHTAPEREEIRTYEYVCEYAGGDARARMRVRVRAERVLARTRAVLVHVLLHANLPPPTPDPALVPNLPKLATARNPYWIELQKTRPTLPVEVHVIRLGDVAIVTIRCHSIHDKISPSTVQTGSLPFSRKLIGTGAGQAHLLTR
jgi:hypothetical protein